MSNYSQSAVTYFEGLLEKYGPTFAALDWHRGGQTSQFLHFEKLLAVNPQMKRHTDFSVLDVGCGFGDLSGYMRNSGYAVDYTGYDIVPDMIACAKEKYPTRHFEVRDILNLPEDTSLRFDYVLASGVVVWIPTSDWTTFIAFAKRMFLLCNRGVAFNMYSRHVPEIVPGRFYADPWEVMLMCWRHITKKIKIDHGYMPETFVVYLYKP